MAPTATATPSASHTFLAAGVAATAELSIMQPLDAIKTRIRDRVWVERREFFLQYFDGWGWRYAANQMWLSPMPRGRRWPYGILVRTVPKRTPRGY